MVHSAPGMSFVVWAGVSGSCAFVLESASNSRLCGGGRGRCRGLDRQEVWSVRSTWCYTRNPGLQTGIIIVGCGWWYGCPKSKPGSSLRPCRKIWIFTLYLRKHSLTPSFSRLHVLSPFSCYLPLYPLTLSSLLPLSEVLINSQPPWEVWDLSLHFVIGLDFTGPLYCCLALSFPLFFTLFLIQGKGLFFSLFTSLCFTSHICRQDLSHMISH